MYQEQELARTHDLGRRVAMVSRDLRAFHAGELTCPQLAPHALPYAQDYARKASATLLRTLLDPGAGATRDP